MVKILIQFGCNIMSYFYMKQVFLVKKQKFGIKSW